MNRPREVREILLTADIVWAEVASGIMLIALRGAVLKWGPVVSIPYDVAALLGSLPIAMTEERWGVYLLICGIIQIGFAGEMRSRVRLAVTIAILAGFVTMTAAFLVIDNGVSPSLVCMSGFYTLLLGRVFKDRDSATAKVGEAHG